MADEFLKDQTLFSGTEIQPTDLFWISVDNGDTTFSTYKITGAQLKQLLNNIYNSDGGIDESRDVSINDGDGILNIHTTKTKLHVSVGNVYLENVVNPSITRRVNLNTTEIEVKSDKVVYEKHQVYADDYATIDSVSVNAATFTPLTASNFQIQAEVKGYHLGSNKVYYARIDGLYRTVSGSANQIDLDTFTQESASSGMSATLVVSGSGVALQLTGVSGDIVTWNYIVKVF